MSKQPRILFLGQKPIGEACFQKLMDSGLPVVGVATNADPALGWWNSAHIWELAGARNIPRLDNRRKSFSELAELIRDTKPDIAISVQHKWILPAEIIQLVPWAYNLHLARLPEYKGYYPFNHVILRRETAFGVVIHKLVVEIDAGPISYSETFTVDPAETAISLYRKAFDAGLRLFDRLLGDLARGYEPAATPQQGEGHFYTRDSIDPFREVPADASPEEIELRARAFHFPPFPGAYMRINGRKILLTPETAA